MTAINLTAQEHFVLILLTVFLIFSVLLPFFYIGLRNLFRPAFPILFDFVFLGIIGCLIIVAIFTRSYALSDWVYMLENGTTVTVVHSSGYLTIVDSYTSTIILLLAVDAIIVCGFLIVDFLEILRQRLRRRY